MKTVAFYGFLDGPANYTLNILCEKEQIERIDDFGKADFLFVGPYHNYMDYYEFPLVKDQVRIFITDEPKTADFTIFDYAVGFDFMEMLGKDGKQRYLRYPYSLKRMYKYKDEACWKGYSKDEAQKILKDKKNFCNFMYSHPSPSGHREAVFEALNKYKKVDSSGTFLNNMEGGFTIPRMDPRKKDFIRSYKFTIACDSIRHPGFCTEKITDAFLSDTIPIYFGDPFVTWDINPKAFINCDDFSSLEEMVKKVKYLDENDNAYIEMLSQPKFNNPNAIEDGYNAYKDFLWYIISQDKSAALRREMYYYDSYAEEKLRFYKCIHYNYERLLNNKGVKLMFKFKNMFKRKNGLGKKD